MFGLATDELPHRLVIYSLVNWKSLYIGAVILIGPVIASYTELNTLKFSDAARKLLLSYHNEYMDREITSVML